MHCCTRGPLRPVHAPFDAHGSSKPQGRSGLLLSRLEDPPPQSPYIPFHRTASHWQPGPGRRPVRSPLAGPRPAPLPWSSVLNLPFGSGSCLRVSFTGSPAHVSAPFGAGAPGPVSGQFSPGDQLEELSRCPAVPVAFRPPALASWACCSRQGILPSLPPAYRPPPGDRTLSGFPRSPRPRHGRVGCPLCAGDGGALPAGLTSPAGTRRLCQQPVPGPRCHSHLAGLAMTTHPRGFTFFTLSAFSLPVPPG